MSQRTDKYVERKPKRKRSTSIKSKDKKRRSRSSSRSSSAKSTKQDEEIKVTCPDKSYKHKALEKFEDADFPEEFNGVFKKLGFTEPTGI